MEPIREWSQDRDETIADWYTAFDPNQNGRIDFQTFTKIAQLLATPNTAGLAEYHLRSEEATERETFLDSVTQSVHEFSRGVGSMFLEKETNYTLEEDWEVLEQYDYDSMEQALTILLTLPRSGIDGDDCTTDFYTLEESRHAETTEEVLTSEKVLRGFPHFY